MMGERMIGPSVADLQRPKRGGRCLRMRPRVKSVYRPQGIDNVFIRAESGSDTAGDLSTIRSTTGIALPNGIRHPGAQTCLQPATILSSSEPECCACIQGAGVALGVHSRIALGVHSRRCHTNLWSQEGAA